MGVDPSWDRIHVRDLVVRCIAGVYPDERREKQDVIINITLYADLRTACASDRIEDTVDYKAIKKRVAAMVEASSAYLIEHLAEQVAALCLEESRVQAVSVSIDKPGALRFAKSVAVEIFRERAAHE